MRLEERVPLAPYTTFQLGGAARFFVRVCSLLELQEAIAWSKARSISILFLGGGSNMLVPDAGFDGLVIKLELEGVSFRKVTAGVEVQASAGVSWDRLVAESVAHGLWGLENLSGIPGSVGAAPVQNIGAYGSEIQDTLISIEVLDTKENTTHIFSNQECEFGYRTSRFKRELGRYVILSATFLLTEEGLPNLTYRDLEVAFKDTPRPSLAMLRSEVLRIRAGKFPDLKEEGTAGSFFMNPIISAEHAALLRERYPELPQFSVEGGIKISLGWLLDKGLGMKGFRVGGARLFEKQSLVIVAAHDASTEDVKKLSTLVKEKIKKEYAIDIETEVRFV